MVITIQDMNDNPPQFAENLYEFNILENQPKGTHIGEVRATDRDTSKFGVTMYRLQDIPTPIQTSFFVQEVPNFGIQNNRTLLRAGNIARKFFINEKGQLSILEKLDREEREVHEILVIASDGGTPPLSTSTRVVVHVRDENDNAVEWIAPFNDGEVFEVPVEAGDNYLITKFKAVDKDADENGRVVFKFGSRRASELTKIFSLNETTGEFSIISIAQATKKVYNLSVVAMDCGSPPTQTTRHIIIEFDGIHFENAYPGSENAIDNPSSGSLSEEKSFATSSFFEKHSNVIIIVSLVLIIFSLVCILVLVVMCFKAKLHKNKKRKTTKSVFAGEKSRKLEKKDNFILNDPHLLHQSCNDIDSSVAEQRFLFSPNCMFSNWEPPCLTFLDKISNFLSVMGTYFLKVGENLKISLKGSSYS